MRLVLFLLITAALLQSCGNGAGTTPASSPNPAGIYQTSKSYSFAAKVDPATLIRQQSIGLNTTIPNRPDNYVISTAADLDALNQSLPEMSGKIVLEDLSTSTYFFIRSPDCPEYADFSHQDYAEGALTISLDVFKWENHSCPEIAGIDAYGVYKAQKAN